MEPTLTSYVTFEDPDITYWHLIGVLEEEHINRIHSERRLFAAGKPFIFNIIDATRLEKVTREARRAVTEGARKGSATSVPVRASAIIGASFHFRVIGGMIDRASRLINREADWPTRFVDNEAEARAWIEQRRGTLV